MKRRVSALVMQLDGLTASAWITVPSEAEVDA